MKIEFVKETKIDGGVMYYTHVDGSYISNSLAHDEEKAKNIYNVIVENKGIYKNVKILDTTIIVEQYHNHE